MLKLPDLSGVSDPLKLLIEGNFDTYSQLYAVIESFKDENLDFKLSPELRSIKEIMLHTICTQICFYTNELLLGKKGECSCGDFNNVKSALEFIEGSFNKITEVWKNIDQSDLEKLIKTEWGAKMTGRIALFQSITQLMYHISEICLYAGRGGFYKGTLG